LKRLAILASGAGSNARNIIEYFQNNPNVVVSLIASNKADAGVLKIANGFNIPTLILTKKNFLESDEFVSVLKEQNISLVILAGFLWKVPFNLVSAFPSAIINIHPALLPKYGGKGMYGHFVHEAVAAAGEKESGITVHFVNENYDEGQIIFQKSFVIGENDTAMDIESNVRKLEIEYFPKVIADLVK